MKIVSKPRAGLRPCFKAALQSDGTLEMLVYEDIGPDYWGEGGVTAKGVKQTLDAAGPYSRISLRINSPGGDAFEGVAICNLLRSQGKPIDVYVDGIAASAASIVAMAGDTITMGVSAMMMVHNAWALAAGSAEDLRKTAEVLDKVSAAMGETYSRRTGLSAAAVKAIMDAETWMNGQECLDQGFATAIAEAGDGAEDSMALAASFKTLAKFRNTPAALRRPSADAAGCVCPCGPCVAGECADCDCSGCGAQDCAEGCGCAVAPAEPSSKGNLSQYEARLRLLAGSRK